MGRGAGRSGKCKMTVCSWAWGFGQSKGCVLIVLLFFYDVLVLPQWWEEPAGSLLLGLRCFIAPWFQCWLQGPGSEEFVSHGPLVPYLTVLRGFCSLFRSEQRARLMFKEQLVLTLEGALLCSGFFLRVQQPLDLLPRRRGPVSKAHQHPPFYLTVGFIYF